ncbi:MAG: hypothetical protein JW829_01965 [Pirellulales bacterium]|nr:hypothetical protein [Pirellulales bacterium]
MMNRTKRCMVLLSCLLAIILMIASQAQAQQRRVSWRFYDNNYAVGIGLLQVEKVQVELKLTDDQIQKATEISEKLSEEMRELYMSVPREQWRERGDDLRKKVNEIAKTAAMKMAESMDEAQKNRWLEVALQARGPAALPDDYLVQHLKLDDAQVKKLNDLNVAQREKMFEMFRQARDQGLSREENAKKFTTLVEEMNQQRLDVLSDDQKAAFQKMQGGKFEFPED